MTTDGTSESTPRRLQAAIACLDGASKPRKKLTLALENAGVGWLPIDISKLSDSQPPEAEILILELRHAWKDGLERFASLPESVRSRVVLAGKDPPPDIGPAIRSRGGLTYVSDGAEEWVVPLVAEAVRRTDNARTFSLLRELRSMTSEAARTRNDFLRDLADVAGRLLCSDFDRVVQLDASEKYEAIFVQGSSAAERNPLPKLWDAAATFGEMILIPDVAHAHVCDRPIRGGPRAAVCIPIIVASERRPIRPGFLLAFYWKHPRLLTAEEYLLAEIVGSLASTHFALLRENVRQSVDHMDSVRALSELTGTGRQVGCENTSDLDSLDRYVDTMLETHVCLPSVVALFASVGANSRRTAPWRSRMKAGVYLTPEAAEAALKDITDLSASSRVRAPDQSVWLRRFVVGRGSSVTGQLIAAFESATAAVDGEAAMCALAASLDLAARLARRAADASALVGLSRALAGDVPATELQTVASIVTAATASDGIKVYVVSSSPLGRVLMQLHRSPIDQELVRRRQVPLSDTEGLVDWVVRNDDWVCIESVVPIEEHQLVVTGCHGEVRIRARPASHFFEGVAPPDDERSLMFVPMHFGKQLCGAVAVWRTTNDPYDSDLDTSSLLYMAPHIMSACLRVMQIERMREELRQMSALAQAIRGEMAPSKVYSQVLAAVGELLDARATILFRHDPKQLGLFFCQAVWVRETTERTEFALSGLALNAGRDREEWEAQLRDAVATRIGHNSALVTHDVVTLRSTGSATRVVVVVTDVTHSNREHNLKKNDLSFFQNYLEGMLTNHLSAYAGHVVEKLGERSRDTDTDWNGYLAKLAALMREATGSDAVVVHSAASGALTTIMSDPHAPSLIGAVTKPPSLVAQCAREKVLMRVLNSDHVEPRLGEIVDASSLRQITAALGWQDARSIICCPIEHLDRTVGVMTLLTSVEGGFLGPDEESIAQALALRSGWELQKLNRRLMLDALNQIANRLATMEGAELSTCIIDEFGRWVGSHVRSGCEIVVTARSSLAPEVLVKAGPAPEYKIGFDSFERFSCAVAGREIAWTRQHPPGPPGDLLKGTAGVAVPIRLAGADMFAGHFFVLHDEPFSTDDVRTLGEAAREIAILVYQEAMRQGWAVTAGKFRHALIGPASGITSAARSLAKLARSASEKRATDLRFGGPEDAMIDGTRSVKMLADARHDIEESKRFSDKVEKEAEIVRRAADTERMYLSGRVELVVREQPLRPVFERCVERYRAGMNLQNLHYTEEWKPKGAVVFSFDEIAIDLALSNLLDNAVKYAFANREITVGAEVTTVGDKVRIWVEDIGTRIPERLRDAIYKPGRRLDWADPVRIVRGEGLGLPIARAVVLAHEGMLSHQCETSGKAENDRTPYRVRFTMELPTRWNRGRHAG